MLIRYTRGSRKHRIGRVHSAYVISTVDPVSTVVSGGDAGLRWVGEDDRGIELEIVAVVLPDCWLVIHVMPTSFEEVNRS